MTGMAGSSYPESPPGDQDLEPGAPAIFANLTDREAGDPECFLHEKQAKPGVLSHTLLEDPLLVAVGNAIAIIFNNDGIPVRGLQTHDPDPGHFPTMHLGILEEI